MKFRVSVSCDARWSGEVDEVGNGVSVFPPITGGSFSIHVYAAPDRSVLMNVTRYEDIEPTIRKLMKLLAPVEDYSDVKY